MLCNIFWRLVLGKVVSLVSGGGEECEAVLVSGLEHPFTVVESAVSFIWTLSEYCQLLDQLPLGEIWPPGQCYGAGKGAAPTPPIENIKKTGK